MATYSPMHIYDGQCIVSISHQRNWHLCTLIFGCTSGPCTFVCSIHRSECHFYGYHSAMIANHKTKRLFKSDQICYTRLVLLLKYIFKWLRKRVSFKFNQIHPTFHVQVFWLFGEHFPSKKMNVLKNLFA